MAEEKSYNAINNQGIELTKRPDEIAHDECGEFRAILSCGHACDPNSLISWCRSQLDDGKCEFTCPAQVTMGDFDAKSCGRVWPYDEVRRLALLTNDEMEEFETKLTENRLKSESSRYKQCPNCSSFIERESESEEEDSGNLRVECVVCKCILKRADYAFCWQCEQPWRRQAYLDSRKVYDCARISKETCGRFNCRNRDLDILAKCILVK